MPTTSTRMLATARRYTSPASREAATMRLRVSVTFGIVAALHLLGLGLALSGGRHALSGGLTAGMVLTAYLAGLKHQADADHINAIDNAIRKFLAEGRRPVSVGLAFSLGHSSIVMGAAILVVIGVRGMGALFEGSNPLAGVLGTTGSLFAGSFLLLIAAANSVTWWRIMRGNDLAEDSTTPLTFLGRLMARPLSRVRFPRHVFVVGALFGLGFDTASLIGLLVLAGSNAEAGVAPTSLLALPICFAAGMTLGDTANAMAMMRLYSSAAARTHRRRLNATITGMSVVSALAIGGMIVLSTCREAFQWHDPLSAFVASINLEYLGFAMIGIFGCIWISTEIVMRTTKCTRSRRIGCGGRLGQGTVRPEVREQREGVALSGRPDLV